jgi:hypothetical protein
MVLPGRRSWCAAAARIVTVAAAGPTRAAASGTTTTSRRSCAVRLLALVAFAAGCGSSGGDGAPAATPSPAPSATPGFASARGFVLASFGFAYPTHGDAVACPSGFNRGPIERQAAGLPPLPDDCLDPTASDDPDFMSMTAPGVLDGFDIDGTVSSDASPAPGECAHDDFSGPAGEAGYDDQLWRAIGCIRGFQDGDVVESVVDGAVRDGSMTILVDVRGVDDATSDDDVEVQVFSSSDAPPLGGDGSVLPFGTLSIDPDPRFHSTVGRGRIENGVVTAGPLDIRVRLNIQIVLGELTFRDAYVRLVLAPDGTATGGIYGYAPLEDVYEIFGRQAGTIGGKEALGYTCSGLHAALAREADGHFDPASGACTSLSTAYRFTGIPAFVAR